METFSSRESEMALLGAVIFDNDVLAEILDLVPSPEVFAFPHHRTIFQAVQRLHGAGRLVDLVLLRDELLKSQKLEEAGGADYLMTLVECVPNTAKAGKYARTVVELARLRSIVRACTEVAAEAKGTKDPAAAREAAEMKLAQVLDAGTKSPVTSVADVMQATFDKLVVKGGKPRLAGISTGFADLDNVLLGLQPGCVYIIAGRPSVGKSILAMNMAEHVIVRERQPVLWFSTDQSAQDLSQQMLCLQAKVDSQLLRSGRVGEEEFQRLVLSAGAYRESQFYVDDTIRLSVNDMVSRARQQKKRNRIKLVVVDYVHRMYALDKVWSPEFRQLELAMISSNLKSLARELEVPVVAVAQLNRNSDREERPPMLADLRQSGTLEEDADVVMLVYQEDLIDPKSPKKGVVQVSVAKNRRGPVGIIEFRFQKHLGRFEPLAARIAPAR